jgi:hypothetical protein
MHHGLHLRRVESRTGHDGAAYVDVVLEQIQPVYSAVIAVQLSSELEAGRRDSELRTRAIALDALRGIDPEGIIARDPGCQDLHRTLKPQAYPGVSCTIDILFGERLE